MHTFDHGEYASCHISVTGQCSVPVADRAVLWSVRFQYVFIRFVVMAAFSVPFFGHTFCTILFSLWRT